MRNVALAILSLPGEAFTHCLDGDEVGKFFEHRPLTGRPGALDELNDTRPHAMPDGAEDHAERRGRFALALAGMDDEQSLLDRLGGHDLVARRLLLFHLLAVTRAVLGDLGVAHCAVSMVMDLSLS